MRNLYSFLFVFTVACITQSVQATDYYFSTLGNDNNTGTIESSPFRTLAKANTLNLLPGDRLLFKRNEIFRGELLIIGSGSSQNPITIDSYGQGAAAVISGSEYIDNWEPVGNGIYRASCAQYPQMVFYNGKPQLLARYPNNGFLFTDGANANNGFSDADLPNGGNFYVGAGVHIRTARYRYEERTVGAQANSYLGFSSPTATNIVAGAGYYLTGKFEFADSATEYYYDAQNLQLYLKTENGLAPPQNTVEASRYDNGIKFESSAHVVVNNIKISHQQKNGIYIYGAPTNGLTLNNCIFDKIYLYAITGANKDNFTVSNSRFSDIHCEAIFIGGITNVLIANNVFKRIGLLAGRATDDKISYKCIEMNGSRGSIQNNILDSIGYNGIQFYQNTVIEKNIVSRFCMSIDDGAGINAYGNANGIRNGTGCIVRYNIVSNATGNAESYPMRPEPFVNGIGMDDNSGNAVFEYNTIYNIAGRGISIHNSVGNQIRNNTVFNCNNGSLVFEHDQFGGMLSGNVTAGNILYNIHENEYALKLANWHYTEPGLDFSSFSNNYYINPYHDVPIFTTGYGYTSGGSYELLQNDYTVRGWQAYKDAGAKASPLKLQNYKITSYLSNNLVTNGSFDNNIVGWECWAPNNTCTINWENAVLDGGSVKLNSPTYFFGFFVNNQTFGVEKNKKYLLTYSVVGGENKINAITVQDRNTNAQLIPRFKREVATTRLEQQLLFSPNASSNAGMLTFYVGPDYTPTYSLDNIKVQEVATVSIDPVTQNLFFVNPGNTVQSFSIAGLYMDVDGNTISGSFVLQPFTSKILLAVETSGPLPLNITEISARQTTETTSIVEWKIATANQDCFMELQKSIDGRNFQSLKTFNTFDNSLKYHFIDEQFTATSYYRVKTYCAGEQGRFSTIAVATKDENKESISVYPNPLIDNKLNVINNAGYTMATIFGADGKIHLKSLLRFGNNVLTLPVTASKGIYMLHLSGNNNLTKTIKVIKQ